MMMFLAGSGVSALARSAHVDSGAVFIDHTELIMSADLNLMAAPDKFVSVQKGKIGDFKP